MNSKNRILGSIIAFIMIITSCLSGLFQEYTNDNVYATHYWADEVYDESSGFYYRNGESDRVKISGYSGMNSNLIIPTKIKGLPVTEICTEAFQGNEKLVSAIIPKSVTLIGEYAFNDCINFVDVTIPDNGIGIGVGAFMDCRKIKSIIIPDSVDMIADQTFDGCENLTNITIGNKVERIGLWAFGYCKNIEKITLPDSVKEIDRGAFLGCEKLRHITVGSGLSSWKYVGNLWGDCQNLEKIDVSKYNKEFYSIDGVLYESVIWGDKAEQKLLLCYPKGKDNNTYNIAYGTTYIAENAFYGNTSLSNVTIPSSVEYIDHSSFKESRLIKSQEGQIKYVDKWVVDADVNTITAEIKDGTLGIAAGAFRDAKGLLKVIIPSSLKVINEGAFCYFEVGANLKTIVIKAINCKINDIAIYNCVIMGYSNSTARKYVDECGAYYNVTFKEIEDSNLLDADKSDLSVKDQAEVINKESYINLTYFAKSNAETELADMSIDYDKDVFEISDTEPSFSRDKKTAYFTLKVLPKKIGDYDITINAPNAQFISKTISVSVEPELILPNSKTGNFYYHYADRTINCDGLLPIMTRNVTFNVKIDEANSNFLEKFLKSIAVSTLKTNDLTAYATYSTSYSIADDGKSAEFVVSVSCGNDDITNYLSVKTAAQEKILQVARTVSRDADNPFLHVLTESNNPIISEVEKYCIDDRSNLYIKYMEVMMNGELEYSEKQEKLANIFHNYDINDVTYGMSFCRRMNQDLLSTQSYRSNYNMLVSDEYYCSSQFDHWLMSNEPKAIAARTSLYASGLIFNNELLGSINLSPELIEHYPEAKKNKEMLRSFLASNNEDNEVLSIVEKTFKYSNAAFKVLGTDDLQRANLSNLQNQMLNAKTDEEWKELQKTYTNMALRA